MTAPPSAPLLRSFERHLRAANRSERTIATYLQSVQQAEAFLHPRPRPRRRHRADREAFLGDLLTRRAASSLHDPRRS